MNPRKERNIILALELAGASDELFERVWSIVFGTKSEWQRLLTGCRFAEVTGQIEDHLPIEQNPTADGVSEVSCPKGKVGRAAYEDLFLKFQPVGPGSALIYIAAQQKRAGKLVITDRSWRCGEDGHEYVAVCDCVSGSICPELVDDLDSSHSFLVRQV
jgi:hypothetical protein